MSRRARLWKNEESLKKYRKGVSSGSAAGDGSLEEIDKLDSEATE